MTAVHKRANATRTRVDREFPHQVALPADFCCMENYRIIERFCRERFGVSPPMREVTAAWSNVAEVRMRLYCFASRAGAEAFAEHFAGEHFNPKVDRGKGLDRNKWKRSGPWAVADRYGPLELPKFFRENP